MTCAEKPVRVAISGKQYAALKQHLLPGDGNEAVAFALCGRARLENLEVLVVKEIVPIPYEACRVRTPYRVTWSGEALEPILARAAKENLGLIKIHSHPTGYPWFSDTGQTRHSVIRRNSGAWYSCRPSFRPRHLQPIQTIAYRSCRVLGNWQHCC